MSSSKFKVEFTLRQHTPIIHFQSDQSGATLRATELKPKFDRFLKEYVFNKKVPSSYKISQEKDALNYKSKTEWRNNNGTSYHTAHINGWFEECTVHMIERKKTNGYWNIKERCIEEASWWRAFRSCS